MNKKKYLSSPVRRALKGQGLCSQFHMQVEGSGVLTCSRSTGYVVSLTMLSMSLLDNVVNDPELLV